MEDFDVLSPDQYTYDFDYTYTFSYKLPSNFSLYPSYSPALSSISGLSVPQFRLMINSCSSCSDGGDGGDSPYPDFSCGSNLSRRYSSCSSSSSSSEDPLRMDTNSMRFIGTHMYDNPGTVSSSTTAYVSRERLAALEFLEKNISTIISEQVRQHYDGYTVSSISVE